MKDYHDYPKINIGYSDIAALVAVGCDENGVNSEIIKFGGDSSYHAYLVDDDAEIGNHYTKVAEFSHWLKIYDDEGLTFDKSADRFEIYTAGDYGCIIKQIDSKSC